MSDDPALFVHDLRGVLAVLGPDAVELLNRLLTIDVETVTPERPRPGALLTPQGKIEVELWVHRMDSEEGCFIDAFFRHVSILEQRLKLFRLRADVTIEKRMHLLSVQTRIDGSGRRLVPSLEHADQATRDAYHARRVADGRPEQGFDYFGRGGEAEVFPTDVNLDLLGGVDYGKGCFIGQEVASRMKRRGIIRKRTIILETEGEAPEHGAEISADGVSLGTAMSSAGGKSLALVRLDRLAQADPSLIRVEGRPANLSFPAWFPEEARRAAGDDAA
jgi:folate-binding protein YgfZ